MTGFKINATDPNVFQMAQVILFHITARRLCCLEPRPSIAPPLPVQTPTQPPTSASRVNTPTIHVGRVLDQRSAEEITYSPNTSMLTYNANYMRVMECEPTPGKAATYDQLTALQYTMDTGRPPYTDFAVFGKYGSRRARAMAFTGLINSRGGTLRMQEILGPSTLQE